MKKRILAVMLAAMLALGVSACAQAEPLRLVFWHAMSDDAGQLITEYVKRFNETIGAEKGIEVEAVYQGTYAEAVTKMNSMLSNGQTDALPDVLQMDATGKVSFASAENAYTVDALLAEHPEIDLSGMLAPAMTNWQLAGVHLGLPFATSTTVTYYNKSVLDAAGFAAPETLSDIGALAGLASENVAVYAAVPNTPTLANWLGQLGSDLVDRHNGAEGTAQALDCIDNGALLAFLTAWKELYATGALVNRSGSTDEFVAGRQLIMTSSSSSVTSLLEKIGGSFELGVAAYPRVNAEAAGGATVSGSCLVMFDHGEDRRQAAWELVQYLTSADIQADFARGTGYLPSNAAAAESEAWQSLIAEYPQYEVGLRQLQDTPDSMRSVTIGPSADFYYAIMNDISDMLDSDLTAEETVEIMQDDLGGMLEQYARANP